MRTFAQCFPLFTQSERDIVTVAHDCAKGRPHMWVVVVMTKGMFTTARAFLRQEASEFANLLTGQDFENDMKALENMEILSGDCAHILVINFIKDLTYVRETINAKLLFSTKPAVSHCD